MSYGMSYGINQQSNKRARIMSLVMGKVSGFGQQYSHPFQTNGTGEVVNRMMDAIYQYASAPTAVTPTIVSGRALEFVQPSANAEKEIFIPNGWGMSRFYFVMIIEIYDTIGSTTYVVQGYTDQADTSLMTRSIDPNTVFYINSVTTVSQRKTVDPRSGAVVGVQPIVSDSVHLFKDHTYGDVDSVYNNQNIMYGLRPTDVFRKMDEEVRSSGVNDLDGYVQNLVGSMNGRPKSSFRRDVVPSQYVSGIVKNYALATAESQFGDSETSRIASAMYKTSEYSLSQDNFLTLIANFNQFGSNTYSEQFTYSNLLMVDPTIDQRAVVKDGEDANYQGLSFSMDPSNSQYWNTNDSSIVVASTFTSCLPAMLIQNGLRIYQFQASALVVNGQRMFATQDMRGFDANDVSPVEPVLRERIITELINPLIACYGNFDIEVRCTIYYATFVKIRMESGYTVEYSAPTFADALTAPLLTQDSNRLNEVAHDFKQLVKTVTGTVNSTDFSDGQASPIAAYAETNFVNTAASQSWDPYQKPAPSQEQQVNPATGGNYFI